MNEGPTCPKTASESQPALAIPNDIPLPLPESPRVQRQNFYAAGAAPYIPLRHLGAHHGIAPPVTIRNVIPVFSAPPLPPPNQSVQLRRPPPPSCIAPPVCIRQAVPVFAAPPVHAEERSVSTAPVTPPADSSVHIEKTESGLQTEHKESVVTQEMQELKI